MRAEPQFSRTASATHDRVDEHLLGRMRRESHPLAAHLHDERSLEWLLLDEFDSSARRDADLVEVPQQLGARVTHASYDEARRLLLLREGTIRRRLDRATSRRNGISVRARRGVAEQRVDALLELLTDVVLEPLGLLVHRVPGVAHRLDQIELDQPMMTNDLERHLLAGSGELHALIWRVGDEAELGQATKHLADRRCAHLEGFGQLLRGDVPP